MTYRDTSTGVKDQRTFYAYGYSFALNTAKTVRSLTLPADTSLEVLAVDLLGVAVTVPAAANPAPVTGTTTTLTATGVDPAGDAAPTYTWAATAVPAGAATPTFGANGTAAAASTTATFAQAGAYTFTVTVADPTSGASAASSVNVTVNQSVRGIGLTPTGPVSLADGQAQQFAAAAVDQFARPFTVPPTFAWSVLSPGVGSVSSTGLYQAPATGTGSATVQATPGGPQVHLGGLTLARGATAVLTSLGSATNRRALILGQAGATSAPPLSIDAASQLDLTDNDLIDHDGTLATVNALLATGIDLGGRSYWTGPGIASTKAAASTIQALGSGQPLATTTVDGGAVASADVLVRYTTYGDATLDGIVNAADYTRTDAGFVLHLTGWQNGDFNYDGLVDGSDYTLIDNVYDTHTAVTPSVLSSPIPTPTATLTTTPTATPAPATASGTAADRGPTATRDSALVAAAATTTHRSRAAEADRPFRATGDLYPADRSAAARPSARDAVVTDAGRFRRGPSLFADRRPAHAAKAVAADPVAPSLGSAVDRSAV